MRMHFDIRIQLTAQTILSSTQKSQENCSKRVPWRQRCVSQIMSIQQLILVPKALGSWADEMDALPSARRP